MRNDHWVGTEFDWVTADPDGNLAIFSTAGYGPVSALALERASDQESIIAAMKSALGIPTALDLLLSPDSGRIILFDWKLHRGPYLRSKRPTDGLPLALDSIPSHLRDAVTLLNFNLTDRDAIYANDVLSSFECANPLSER